MLKNRFSKQLISSAFDLMPMVAVVLVFQVLVVRQPIPDALHLIFGSVLVVIGLTLFVLGLEQSLFPLGEGMAYAFARKGSVFWLLLFSFCLGFGTTVAEPALIAISDEAARVAAPEQSAEAAAAQKSYAFGLRLTVALSVGTAIVLGVLRILRGWPLHRLIIGGYCLVIVLTPFAPASIVGVAYDFGGVATSTITVPLVTALGVGLASSIKGRNPMIDGFGLIAFASLMPIIFVLIYGMLS